MKLKGEGVRWQGTSVFVAVAAALFLGGGLGLAVGLTQDAVGAGGDAHGDAFAFASASASDCAVGKRAGGRVIEISASDVSESPLDLRRLGLKKGEYVLTFDDGPTWITDEILDTLDGYCAKATFFMIGKRAEQRPKTVLRALRDGHSIGNHTYEHVNLLKLPLQDAVTQIRRGSEAIAAAADRDDVAVLLRPPAFRINSEIRAAAARLGAVEIGPDISPKDWKGDAADKTMARLRGALARKDRGVILLHDNQPNTRWVLKSLLSEFAGGDRRIVALKVTR